MASGVSKLFCGFGPEKSNDYIRKLEVAVGAAAFAALLAGVAGVVGLEGAMAKSTALWVQVGLLAGVVTAVTAGAISLKPKRAVAIIVLAAIIASAPCVLGTLGATGHRSAYSALWTGTGFAIFGTVVTGVPLLGILTAK